MLDRQRLHRDGMGLVGNMAGCRVRPAASLVGDLRARFIKFPFRAVASVAAFLTPRNHALITSLAMLESIEPRLMQQLPVTGRDLTDVHVNANDATVVSRHPAFHGIGDDRIPLAMPLDNPCLLRDAVRVRVAAAAPQLAPTDLRYVELSLRDLYVIGDRKAVVCCVSTLEFGHPNVTGRVVEEIAPGERLVFQRITNDAEGMVLKPRRALAQGGEGLTEPKEVGWLIDGCRFEAVGVGEAAVELVVVQLLGEKMIPDESAGRRQPFELLRFGSRDGQQSIGDLAMGRFHGRKYRKNYVFVHIYHLTGSSGYKSLYKRKLTR